MNVYDEIINSIKEKLNLKEIDTNATLASLGLDSLDVVECVLDIEEKYKIKFEPTETQELKTLGDLLKVIEKKVK